MDFIKYLQEIRGTSAIGEELTDGIYWELTKQLHNGSPGLYGDILKMYGIIGGDKSDFDNKYKDFLDRYAFVTVEADRAHASEVNAEVFAINAKLYADSIHEITVEQIPYTESVSYTADTNTLNIPAGIPGVNGLNGKSPNYVFTYNTDTGDLEFDLDYWSNETTIDTEEIV
jgi:hypothetical protein